MGAKFHNINVWIEDNKAHFLPPVCNKLMHSDQLKVFYVGGPNQRKDFHLEEGEELFYMKKGDMEVIVTERGQLKSIVIREGQVFLLPGKIMHSPQRKADTIGLVIERERLPEERDCLRYYVGDTTESLFERWFYCDDLGTQLVPVIKEFFASEQCRTGRPIDGTIPENPPYRPDPERIMEDPFDLRQWLQDHRSEIMEKGSKMLFDPSAYQSQITVYGPSGHDRPITNRSGETWLWQLEGESNVAVSADSIRLDKDDTLLIEPDQPFRLVAATTTECSFLMSVVMDPNRKM